MAAKFLVYLCAQRATVARWQSGVLSHHQTYANTEEGRANFNAALQGHLNTPLYLLVDSVEEDYRSETLPHTQGRARREMLARKLKQVFRNTPFCAALPQGREDDKRRDDRFLFMSLTGMELLRPWLEIITARHLPFAGIYLLPVVSQALVVKLQLDDPHLLLVSEQSSGLRLSYFQQQCLKISRLTPLDNIRDESYISTYFNEIGKTQLYLDSQRQFTRDERLTVCLLDAKDSMATLGERVNAEPGLACRVISSSQLANKLGVSQNTLRDIPDALMLTMLGLHAPSANLALPALTREFRHYQVRRALYGLSTATLLAAIVWGGVNLYLQLGYLAETEQTIIQIRRHEALYQDVAKQFPQAPASADTLKKAVDIAAVLQQGSRMPEAAMAVVSRALDANPQIALNRLRWKRDINQIGSDENEPGAAKAASPTPANTPQNAVDTRSQLIYLDGDIMPFSGDYRAAIETINLLVDSFKHDALVANVTILQLPLNINPSAGLSGSASIRPDQSLGAHFKLKITLKAAI